MWKVAPVVLFVFTAGCGVDQARCHTSIDARTRGDYDHGQPADLERSYACASACYDLYSGDDWSLKANAIHPVCVESSLISADRDPTATKDVREACEYGSAVACKWLEQHKQQMEDAEGAKLQREKDEREKAEAAELARPKMTLAEANSAVARVGDQLVREAPSNGYRLDLDQTLDVSDGGGTIPWNYSAGAQYRVYAISGHTTTFSARLGGVGVTSVSFSSRSLDGSVFVLAAELPIDPDVGSNIQIYVTDAGGDQHPVRVLVFRSN
ncbi:MAG: hypothetical protein U0414_16805 [Polyangiaceae bacterium]